MIDDKAIWKRLIIAIINRALQDLEGKSPSLPGSTDKELYMDNMKRNARKFLNSEYCELMADVAGLDIDIIRRVKGLQKSVNQIHKNTPKSKKSK